MRLWYVESAQHGLLLNVMQSTDPASLLAVGKFVVALEARLALLIEAKVGSFSAHPSISPDQFIPSQEQNMQIPPSQRMLLCMLFREIRLLTKSLKPCVHSTPALQLTVSRHLALQSNLAATHHTLVFLLFR